MGAAFILPDPGEVNNELVQKTLRLLIATGVFFGAYQLRNESQVALTPGRAGAQSVVTAAVVVVFRCVS
jgi:hypothetical protein